MNALPVQQEMTALTEQESRGGIAVVTPEPPRKAAVSGQRREIELDFIRGIAILLVLTFHTRNDSPLEPFLHRLGIPDVGWAGVDVFFVLSGFLVGGLLVKEWRLNGRIDSRRFMIRRALKIWPAYYFFLILQLATGHRPFSELVGSFLNIQNYYELAVAHTWSLAVEEHFYLLLLLCMAVAARYRANFRHLLVILGTVGIAVTCLRLYLVLHGVDVYYTTHTRIDGLIWGVMLAILRHNWPDQFRALQRYRWVFLLIIGLSLLDWWFPTHAWTNALSISCADWSGVALLMLLYTNPGRRRNWLYRFVAWIGVYSYGIYLWHVSIAAPWRHVAAHLPMTIRPLCVWLGLIVWGCAIGIITTRLVEFPMLRVRDRLFPRPVDSGAGIPAVVEASAGS